VIIDIVHVTAEEGALPDEFSNRQKFLTSSVLSTVRPCMQFWSAVKLLLGISAYARGCRYGGHGNPCFIAAQSKFSQPSRNLWRTGENNVTPPYKEAA